MSRSATKWILPFVFGVLIPGLAAPMIPNRPDILLPLIGLSILIAIACVLWERWHNARIKRLQVLPIFLMAGGFLTFCIGSVLFYRNHSVTVTATATDDVVRPSVANSPSSIVEPSGGINTINPPLHINANSGIVAPGATGSITQYNNVVPPLPPALLEEIQRLDAIFAGKDELQLRTLFGLQEIVPLNIEINKQRLIQFKKTGGTYFDFEPYRQGRELQVDISWAPQAFEPKPHGGQLNLDINVVSVLVLPTNFSVNKKRLLEFENSSFLPTEVTANVREFDKALDDNMMSVFKILNVALRENPDYFLKSNEFNTPFFKVIEARYAYQFISLRPLADRIRDSARAVLKRQ
jgi:hypothetical protein